jgi:hypothetical protein
MNHVRDMLVSNSKSFTIELGVQVHLNSSLRIFGIKVALFGFTEISALEVELCLVHEYLGDTLRVELSSDLKCRVPVLLVLIHIDSLLRFVSLDEFLLSFFKTILVL